jgi:hypothetical protein
VVVEAGATAEADLTLVEAVEADGWVAIDTHSHGSPSIDGECTIEERLVTAAANDLQVHVSSDHDHVADYRPVAAALGLDARLATVPGDEISSNVRGHHNIYPLEPDPALPNGGAPRWWDEVQSTCDLYDEWHARAGEGGLLQVNHGRETGMFAAAEYDPVTGEAGEPDRYCADFDAMELLNSKGFGEAEEQLLDFVSHLDRGYRPVAVGVSDSHGRLSGPGFPRTLVDAGLDRVTAGDVPAVMDALRAQRAQVCGGPFLRLTASDGHTTVGPGETLAAATATLAIEVLAPSWIPVERVRLLGPGGAVVQEWTVDPGVVKPPLWFSAEVQVAPAADAWYLVRADGSADLWPAWSGAHPFSATNPVFVDVP